MTDHGAPNQLRSIHRQLPLATGRVIAALMLREMAATYGRRPGGYLWSVLEPVAGIALLSFAFAAAGMKNPALGSNFAMFYATGLLPFYVFSSVSGRLTGALRDSKALLEYPRVTFVDVLVSRFLLHMLTQLLVSYIILAGIVALSDTGTQFLAERVILGFGMAAALAAGVGVLNCYLTTQFPVYGNLWRIATRPLMLVSGTMFLVERLPAEWQPWFLWNPLVHVVAEVRAGFYHGYDPLFVSPTLVFGVALASGVVGLLFLWRYHRDVLED